MWHLRERDGSVTSILISTILNIGFLEKETVVLYMLLFIIAYTILLYSIGYSYTLVWTFIVICNRNNCL